MSSRYTAMSSWRSWADIVGLTRLRRLITAPNAGIGFGGRALAVRSIIPWRILLRGSPVGLYWIAVLG